MKYLGIMAVLCVVGAALGDYEEFGGRTQKLKPTKFLKAYKGFVNDFYRKKDAYKMEYNVGDSARTEQRTDSGEVSGTYAFVAPEGDEYEFKYEADKEGFKVEGDALPQAPEETDDVKAAKVAFFEAYERQVELAGDYDSDEYDDDSEEDSSEEISSEEHSEESDYFDDDSDEDDDDENLITKFQRINSNVNQRTQPAISRSKAAITAEPKVPTPATSFFSIPYPYSRRS